MAKKKARARGKVGRKPKLGDLATRKLVLDALTDGASFEDAAVAGGMCAATVHGWRQRDAEFAQQVEQARAGGNVELLREAKRRALKGSDYLLWKLIASRMPEYSEKGGQTNVSINTNIEAPRVIFEIVDKRAGIDPPEDPPRPSGLLEQ